MVTLNVSVDFARAQQRLNALASDVRRKALPSALNKTVEQARTAMTRGIIAEFNLTATKVRQKLSIRRASARGGEFQLQATLASADPSGKRRAINLINFAARQTKAGLSFKIKRQGSRKVSRAGFIGNKGRTAFKREGKARLPIKPLQTIDVPQMFNTKRINAAVVRVVREKFEANLERDIAFFTSKFGSR